MFVMAFHDTYGMPINITRCSNNYGPYQFQMCIRDRDYIIDSAYDSVYGARPIKRFIQSRVETLIAKAIIQGCLLYTSCTIS